MAIAVLLLLTVPLTVASPLRPNQRPDEDSLLTETAVQAERVSRSEVMPHRPGLSVKIVPFHSEGEQEDGDSLKRSVKARRRRAPQRGCQLGTCQLHNLANTLYHISKTSGKDESKKAKDPQGYGR